MGEIDCGKVIMGKIHIGSIKEIVHNIASFLKAAYMLFSGDPMARMRDVLR